MAALHECDRCHKAVAKGHIREVVSDYGTQELCPDCSADLWEFLKGSDLVKPEPMVPAPGAIRRVPPVDLEGEPPTAEEIEKRMFGSGAD